MNVIISNKYKQELESLEIDISKKLEGEFEVEELIDTFSDYFFNKMIIDVTAIKDYLNFNTLQKLSISLNVEKIIFLLDHDNVKPDFLSQLVSMGIYNFTSTIEGVMYLYNNPNSYRDVVQYQDSSFLTSDKDNNQNENEAIEESEHANERNYNFSSYSSNSEQHIIGIKNLTKGAGATTLAYMLKNELCKYKDTVAIEVNKKDFLFLRDTELISVEEKNLMNELNRQANRDIIILDLNNYSNLSICTDVIYLIEPSLIKLNKMIMVDRKIFEKLMGKKIILNKSLLEKKDISSFELESNSKVYYNIPPLDEKKSNSEYLLPLLEKLGLLENHSSYDGTHEDKFLGIFNI